MFTNKLSMVVATIMLSITSSAYGQRYQNNVRFMTPPSSFFSHDEDKFDEIKCDTSIQTASNQTRYYDYTLNREDFLKTPEWNPMSDRPAVPPENAVRLASKSFNTIKPFGNSDASIVEIQMQSYWNRWVWAVIFQAKPSDDRVIATNRFPVFVMMDGTVLKPEETTPQYLNTTPKLDGR